MQVIDHRREHDRACLVCMASARQLSLQGTDLASFFFEPRFRRGQAWSSTEAARLLLVPVTRMHAAFRSAAEDGLAELSPDGWRWLG